MLGKGTDSSSVVLIVCLILITGVIVAGDSLETDTDVLLKLKSYLEGKNLVNRGRYSKWNGQNASSPCDWPGIICSYDGARVTGVNLSNDEISGEIFGNFSLLSELSYLDLSRNTLHGEIPADLSQCQNLKYLNLSHNILVGELNLSGLKNLVKLDLSMNRLFGEVRTSFPAICQSLVVANISTNNFTGGIYDSFDACLKLQYLDLSSNNFTGNLWPGFARLLEFSVSENLLRGPVLSVGVIRSLLEEAERRNQEIHEKGKKALTAILSSLPSPISTMQRTTSQLMINEPSERAYTMHGPRGTYRQVYMPKATKQRGFQTSRNLAFKPYHTGESSGSSIPRLSAPPPIHPRNKIKKGGADLS